jgi:hypothetical protein
MRGCRGREGSMTTNTLSIDRFCEELAADPRFSPYADQIRTKLMDVDCRGDTCPDHAGFFDGLRWIFTHDDHSLAERLEMMGRLSDLKNGYQIVEMRSFTGWE